MRKYRISTQINYNMGFVVRANVIKLFAFKYFNLWKIILMFRLIHGKKIIKTNGDVTQLMDIT
jgi:hypothetical protein